MHVAVLAALVAMSAACVAAPFVPADDAQVLERLPGGGDARLARLAAERSAWRTAPDDPRRVAAFAQAAIVANRASGDPRYLGEARAALKRWDRAAEMPADLLLLRATVRQSLHDFAGALADLDALLARAPGHAQARLTRATVRNVIGRHADAIADCDALAGHAPPLVVDACRADTAGRGGRAREALALVTRALGTQPGSVEVRAWAATIAAELAARMGEADVAERHFRLALALVPADVYALGAYADFLLDAGRAGDAAALVAAHTRHDALLLRHVIAQVREGVRDSASQRELAARMAAARQRGDDVHLREVARHALEVEGDAARAVALARANFAVQREPADVRLLAEAGRTAGDAAALAMARGWMRTTGLEDVRLAALVGGEA